MKKYRLSHKQLKNYYNTRHFKFNTTAELEPIDEIIGQDRAVKAMEFGLNVKNSKYNIFVSGSKGTGKTSYCTSKIKEKAKSEKKADDWCYVYNFNDPYKPSVINLPAGMGKQFKEDIESLVHDLLTEAPKTLISEEYEKRKNDIIKEFQDGKKELLDILSKYSQEHKFITSNTSTGLIFIPVKDGEKLSDEEYESLDENEKKEYEQNAENLQVKALEILKKIKILEREAKKKIDDFQKMAVHFVIKPIFELLYERYKEYKKAMTFIKNIEEDIVENISDLEVLAEEEIPLNIDIKEIAPKYYVNLFIDNEKTEGAPVVIETNPTYNNLFGLVEYQSEKGSLKTDFTMIKPGAIHRANGGYIIIQAEELLRDIYSWMTLKRILKTGELKIESLRQQLGISNLVNLNPEPIPINIKVILIGNPHIYNLLYSYDEDFHKYFKIKVDFDSVMENNHNNIIKMAYFIASFCEKEGLKHFHRDAVGKVVEYSNKLAGSQNKLSTKFNKIVEILIEADAWANFENSDIVKSKHIERAITEKKYRSNRIEDKIDELYRNGKIVIDVKGYKIGRINGLSVIDMGDYAFGKPTVITVSSYAGSKGIINIEREVEMSGSIHDKGVMILEGYLNEQFCKKEPMNVTSKICFEQSYNGIDGDSASSTELYAILSSIGNIPLKQNIAVTGSVNQKGEIQPVGGITEKVEGFYNTCKYLGLTGDQGVIIPIQNIDDLVLCDEVVESVKDGNFHIYAVSNIEEGMEILTDKSFKNIKEIIEKKLREYNEIIRENQKE